MKNLIYIGTIVVALVSCSESPELSKDQIDTSTQQILNNLNEQRAAWNEGDIDAFMGHYWKSDSMAFVSKDNVRYGWQKTLEAYKSGYPTKKDMGELEFVVKQLDILSPESAYMIGSWHLERDSLDVGGHFSLIWKKVNDNWVIVTDHTS